MPKKRLFLSLILSLGLLTTILTPAQARTIPNPVIEPQAIDAYLQSFLKDNRVPGLAVTIVKDHQVVFSQGYGQASPQRPMTPQTQMYIGSLSKSMTALAVMRLAEEGRIDLDAPVQRYLPWFLIADEQASAQITLRHLLNHTSGISEASDPNNAYIGSSLEDQVRAMSAARLAAPVGTHFYYYSQNYRVLGLVIEKVTGQSYGDYLRSAIFDPLQMNSTVTNPADSTSLAQGYAQFFGFPLERDEVFRPGALPAGYIISTSDDLARYMLAVMEMDAPIIQAQTFQALLTPSAGLESEYAGGWSVGQDSSYGRVWYASGNLENYHSEILMLPDQNIGIALLVNQFGFEAMLNQYPILINGLGQVISGDPVKPAPFLAFNLVLTLIAAADLAVHAWNFGRLKLKLQQVRAWHPLARWPWALVDVVWPLAVLLGLPLMISWVMNGNGGWPELYGLLPDLTLWLWLSLGLGLLRGLVKIQALLRPVRA